MKIINKLYHSSAQVSKGAQNPIQVDLVALREAVQNKVSIKEIKKISGV